MPSSSRMEAGASSSEAVTQFAHAILHGDDEHRAWLTEAAEAFVAGQPMPLPRGKGTQPASLSPPAVPVPEEVRRLSEAATLKCEWVVKPFDSDCGYWIAAISKNTSMGDMPVAGQMIEGNAAFIVAAVNWVRSLLAAPQAGRVDESPLFGQGKGGSGFFRDGQPVSGYHYNPSFRQTYPIAPAAESGRVVPEGWRLVPVEPTEAMWQAGREADAYPGDSYSAVYRAMLEAAPAPAGATVGEGWQPIETAPRPKVGARGNGPVIWIGGPGYALEGWWSSYDGGWLVEGSGDEISESPPSPPTHWQEWRLPEPPTASAPPAEGA